MRKVISLFLKGIIFLCSMTGITLAVVFRMPLTTTLMYFTNQSNVWISFTCLAFLILNLIELKKGVKLIKKWMYILKYMFTVSITITCLVFCVILAPISSDYIEPWSLESILVHVIVPILSIVDLFVEEKRYNISLKHSFFALIPPTCYLIFATICFFNNLDFGYGLNYPYFFLDWGSPVGVFGISNNEPYLGTFYWIMMLLIVFYSISIIYFILLKKEKRCYEN